MASAHLLVPALAFSFLDSWIGRGSGLLLGRSL
jgi:hypothetical protein